VGINAFDTSGRNQDCHLENGISNSRIPITTGIPSTVYQYAALVKDLKVKSQAIYNVPWTAVCETVVAVEKK
jgi:hypothetical protein